MFARLSPLVVILALTAPAIADDWPQWLGPKRDGIWRETGIISSFPAAGPKFVWKTPLGEGYSGPAVANGKVYITDRIRAKDAKNPDSPFNAKARIEGTERVLCLDAATGKILWKHEYPCPYQISYASGPRTTPAVSGGKVYTLGSMGDLYCLDAEKGDVIWSKNLLQEYKMPVPYWGFSGHPVVEGNRLICLVGGKGSVAVGFDKDSGKEVWKQLSANEPGYCPPTPVELDGQKAVVIWHPEGLSALNPQTGDIFWSFAYTGKGKGKAVKAGMTISTPRVEGDQLFVTSFYEGSLMLKLNGVKMPTEVWRVAGRSEQPDDTKALHCVMSTPIFKDGHIYGVDSYGELRCLNAKTGERLWSTSAATVGKALRWANAFLVENDGRFFLFNELGDVIIAKMSPKGYEEISRANILAPTNTMAAPAGRRVIWSHPAFADHSIFARNDESIVRVSLVKE